MSAPHVDEATTALEHAGEVDEGTRAERYYLAAAAVRADLARVEQLRVQNALAALQLDLEGHDPEQEHADGAITRRRNALKSIIREGLGL